MGINASKTILTNLNSDETIKFVTHSMGAAYCKGFISEMQKYAAENGIDISDKIVFELDLAPFQSSSQKANPSVKTFVLQHKYDAIAKCEEMPGNTNRLVTHHYIPENLWERLKMSYTEHQVTSFALEEIKVILNDIIK